MGSGNSKVHEDTDQLENWKSSVQLLPYILPELPYLHVHSHLLAYESPPLGYFSPYLIKRPCWVGAAWNEKSSAFRFTGVDLMDCYYHADLFCLEFHQIKESLFPGSMDYDEFLDIFVSAFERHDAVLRYRCSAVNVFRTYSDVIDGIEMVINLRRHHGAVTTMIVVLEREFTHTPNYYQRKEEQDKENEANDDNRGVARSTGSMPVLKPDDPTAFTLRPKKDRKKSTFNEADGVLSARMMRAFAAQLNIDETTAEAMREIQRLNSCTEKSRHTVFDSALTPLFLAYHELAQGTTTQHLLYLVNRISHLEEELAAAQAKAGLEVRSPKTPMRPRTLRSLGERPPEEPASQPASMVRLESDAGVPRSSDFFRRKSLDPMMQSLAEGKDASLALREHTVATGDHLSSYALSESNYNILASEPSFGAPFAATAVPFVVADDYFETSSMNRSDSSSDVGKSVYSAQRRAASPVAISVTTASEPTNHSIETEEGDNFLAEETSVPEDASKNDNATANTAELVSKIIENTVPSLAVEDTRNHPNPATASVDNCDPLPRSVRDEEGSIPSVCHLKSLMDRNMPRSPSGSKFPNSEEMASMVDLLQRSLYAAKTSNPRQDSVATVRATNSGGISVEFDVTPIDLLASPVAASMVAQLEKKIANSRPSSGAPLRPSSCQSSLRVSSGGNSNASSNTISPVETVVLPRAGQKIAGSSPAPIQLPPSSIDIPQPIPEVRQSKPRRSPIRPIFPISAHLNQVLSSNSS